MSDFSRVGSKCESTSSSFCNEIRRRSAFNNQNNRVLGWRLLGLRVKVAQVNEVRFIAIGFLNTGTSLFREVG